MGSRHRWEAGTSCLGNEGALGAALRRLILVSGGLGNCRLIRFFFNFFFFFWDVGREVYLLRMRRKSGEKSWKEGERGWRRCEMIIVTAGHGVTQRDILGWLALWVRMELRTQQGRSNPIRSHWAFHLPSCAFGAVQVQARRRRTTGSSGKHQKDSSFIFKDQQRSTRWDPPQNHMPHRTWTRVLNALGHQLMVVCPSNSTAHLLGWESAASDNEGTAKHVFGQPHSFGENWWLRRHCPRRVFCFYFPYRQSQRLEQVRTLSSKGVSQEVWAQKNSYELSLNFISAICSVWFWKKRKSGQK